MAFLVLILFLFFSNRICKETLDTIKMRKELQEQAEGEGLKSPNASPLDQQMTFKEQVCS